MLEIKGLIYETNEYNLKVEKYNESSNLNLLNNEEIAELEISKQTNIKRQEFIKRMLKKINEERVKLEKTKEYLKNAEEGVKIGCTVIIRKNDICKEFVDAIVNPANERLEHIGGAALSIINAGGDVILNESAEYIKKFCKLSTGSVLVTNAGNLNYKKRDDSEEEIITHHKKKKNQNKSSDRDSNSDSDSKVKKRKKKHHNSSDSDESEKSDKKSKKDNKKKKEKALKDSSKSNKKRNKKDKSDNDDLSD